MKRIVSVLYFLIINIVIIAQTQYDYYDDDVAHEKPVIDGYAILGLVILSLTTEKMYVNFVLKNLQLVRQSLMK